MTAIIGYTSRNEESSIGVLYADSLSTTTWKSGSSRKVDKLSKMSNRYVFGVTGLEILHRIINLSIENSYTKKPNYIFESINQIEYSLSEFIPSIIKKIKVTNEYSDKFIDSQIDYTSSIILLDLFDNRLYYSNVGKVWKADRINNYKIKFELLDDGLYEFGVIAELPYNFNEYKELNRIVIEEFLENKFLNYEINYNEVGSLGSTLININGKNTYFHFKSCFDSIV